MTASGGTAVFGAQGWLLAYPVAEGVRLWDAREGREIGFLAAVDIFLVGFDAAEENLLLCGPEGLLRCSIKAKPAHGVIDLGAPRLVLAQRQPEGVIMSADRRFCALRFAGEGRWRILRTDTFTEVAWTGNQPGANFAAFSPDGKFLASGAIHYPGVKVFR